MKAKFLHECHNLNVDLANIDLDGAFVEYSPSLQFLDSHEARSDTILVDVDVSILDPDE